MNVAEFGEASLSADGRAYGVIWEDPREVHQIRMTFSGAAPSAGDLSLEYWQSSWPQRRIPRDAPSGSGGSGWLDVGDWHQGKWMKAAADIKVDGKTAEFRFRSIKEEFPELEDFDADYRTTFKLRVMSANVLPKIASFEPVTDAAWRPLEVEILWNGNAGGELKAFNGRVDKIEPLNASDMSGIKAQVTYAEAGHFNSFDETVLTVRTPSDTFSFAPVDLLRHRRIVLPDFGVLVRLPGDTVSYEQAVAETNDPGNKDVYSRVSDMPEQTFPNAWNAMPQKQRQYIPLSFEGGRQHFRLDPCGAVACNLNYIRRLRGEDTDRCLWEGDEIRYSFGIQTPDITERELADGCLPVVTTTYERDGVRYRQTAFVTPLMGVPEPGGRIEADDPLAMMLRFEMELIEGDQQRARLEFAVNDQRLSVDGDKIVEQARLRILLPGLKGLGTNAEHLVQEQMPPKKVIHVAALTRERPKSSVDAVIPFITFPAKEEGGEWAALRALNFDKSLADVTAWWRGRVAQSTQVVTPEPMINDFYKAHVSHLLINTERDVAATQDTLRYMAKVGTFFYGVYANEACMMVSDLDRRGFNDRAEEAIATWLHYQGSRALPGTYASRDGVFYGAGGYEDANGYNQHHGWVLWCMGEHYWYTRDNDWINAAATNIVKACDWIATERRGTVEAADRSPLRSIEKGLLPQGALEDIGDWRTWLSTNVYSWWGLNNAAAALNAARHPDGPRLVQEANAYKRDLADAVDEAMRRAPVVRLRDGAWVPNIPSDLHRRGRSFGWITETLEGSIHLVRCGVIEPWARTSTWVIQDFEDNRYISDQYGYSLAGDDFDRYWFNRGGISQQANLLCNPIPYLLRDEPEHFLRAFFNAFAASYFPDTRMMTEHALPNIGDWCGDHYKASDEANSTYWLRMMFVQEQRNDLWIGAAIPRYWLADANKIGITDARTYFGTMSATYVSNAKSGTITAMVTPPKRNPPEKIHVRFRHPEKARMTGCEVDGRQVPFDADKEWVELKGVDAGGEMKIVARF